MTDMLDAIVAARKVGGSDADLTAAGARQGQREAERAARKK